MLSFVYPLFLIVCCFGISHLLIRVLTGSYSDAVKLVCFVVACTLLDMLLVTFAHQAHWTQYANFALSPLFLLVLPIGAMRRWSETPF